MPVYYEDIPNYNDVARQLPPSIDSIARFHVSTSSPFKTAFRGAPVSDHDCAGVQSGLRL